MNSRFHAISWWRSAIFVLLLACSAKLFLDRREVRAAAPAQYVTETVDQGAGGRSEAAADKVIRQRAQEGWEVVSVSVYFHDVPSNAYPVGAGPMYFIVFRK